MFNAAVSTVAEKRVEGERVDAHSSATQQVVSEEWECMLGRDDWHV